MNLNTVMVAGNLTRDPEIRYTQGGSAICTVGIAVNQKRKTASGEYKADVTFVDATAFGKTAETIKTHLRKGRGIFIQGRLKTETWTDKATQKNRSRTAIYIENFQFTDGPPAPTETESAPAASDTAQAAEPPQRSNAVQDDIPF